MGPPLTSSASGGAERSRLSRPAALRQRVKRLDLALLGTAFALTLITWPISEFEPQLGLDPSWRTALQMATHDGLDFGRDITFTYGPLGFLREPQLAFPWLARMSFAYATLMQAALCLTLLWALRRNLGSLLLAAPVAFFVAEAAVEEPVPVLVFAIAVALVQGYLPPRLVSWVLAAIGVLVGIQLLGKLNVGIIVLALSAIALFATERPRGRPAAWFTGGLLVTVVMAWWLTGQPAAAIGDYLRSSIEIISGYTQAMTFEQPDGTWQFYGAAILAAVGLTIVARGDSCRTRRPRLALTALWAVLAFTAFKSGFVRHDGGHASIYFASMLGGLAVLPLAHLQRATTGLVLLIAALALLGARDGDPRDYVAPTTQARAFFEQAAVLVDPSTTNEHIVEARDRLIAGTNLDAESRAQLDGHSVHIEPYETNIAYAYRLRWRPLPVFQSYSAYTKHLDDRNAAAFASAHGPERVLRHAVSAVDGRNTAWESPAAARAMLCHFRAVSTNAVWQVLARAPDRCGAPRPIGESRSRFGASVPIPPAPDRHSAIYAVLEGVDVRGSERLVNVLYRAWQRTATLDGARRFRLVPGTARNGLLLRVPPAADFAAPFALDQAAEQLSVTRGTGSQPGGVIRVRWYAFTVR